MRDFAKNHIGSEWKHLAAELGFTEAKIQQFEMDHKRVENAIYQMLLDWQTNPQHDLQELEQALFQCGNAELAGKIREKLRGKFSLGSTQTFM